MKKLAPFLITLIAVSALIFWLRFEKRFWICSCGQILLWVNDAWSSNTSQHLFDPYSFTHLLHGFLFCWLIMLILPRFSLSWQLCFAILGEAAWEALENTNFIVERYREGTAALGYNGDTIINSLSDILMCTAGFLLAKRLGLYRSVAVFLAIEIFLLCWIRDSLLLNILMLIYPIDWLKDWQSGK